MNITLDELQALPPAHQDLILAELELKRHRGRKFYRMFPETGKYRRALYKKHMRLYALGRTHRQRAFMAANRVGKTVAGLFEVVCHMTGEYPDWWEGRRFSGPVRVWLSGDTGKSVREGLQPKMLGEWGEFGTGMLPFDKLVRWTPKQGVAEAVDTFTVKHKSGGYSRAEFKSYDQRRESFQSTERDVILLDEEPPSDIYMECLTRTATNNGMVLLTFTPLQGVSDVVTMFLTNSVPVEGPIDNSRALVGASWDDVPHLSKEAKDELLSQYPEHMRAARTRGLPLLGSGLVFNRVAEDSIVCEPFNIPDSWPQGGGMDFGVSHPFAATRMAWDRDSDVIYVTRDLRQPDLLPTVAWASLKSWGEWLPWAWPHDGLQREKSNKTPLKDTYKGAGFSMMEERAQFPDGSSSVETGIMEMTERMLTGRWRVFTLCNAWREEFRTYHRKDGLIVKERDDAISASRYGYMMRRYWRLPPAGRSRKLVVNTNWKRG